MNHSQRTILLISPLPGDRILIRDLLAKDPHHQYRFIEAETGAAALALCRNERPDCVLLDNRLVGMSGREVLQRFTSECGSNSLPVVLLSSSDELPTALAALDEGAHDIFNKDSWRTEELQRAVSNAIEKVALLQSRDIAASRLQQQGSFWRSVFDCLPAHVVVIDEHGIIRAANESWQRFARENGATASAVSVGANYLEVCRRASMAGDLLARDTLDGIEAVIARRDDSFVLEYPCHTPGNERWFVLHVRRLSEESPDLILHHIDITERKLVEQALTLTNEHLHCFVENAPAAIAMLDRQMRYLAVSRRWLTDYGLSGDLRGRSHYEVFPEIPERWKEIHRRCLAGAVECAEEDEFQRSDGASQWLQWEVRPWFDASAAIGGIVLFTEDITKRKRAEEALRASEARLRSHIEHSPLGVVEWDRNFVVTRWAGDAEKIFGWSAAEVVGRGLADLHLVYDEDRAIVDEAISHLTDGVSDRVTSSNRNYTKDRRVIHCTWYNSVLHDSQGKMKSVLSLVLDISERKQAENALKEADRKKDEFLATLAHELRNPLAPLRLGLEVLRRGDLDPSTEENVQQMMERALLQAVRLVDDLLDISRIPQGKLQFHKECVELTDVVRTAVEASRPAIDEKHHQLTIELPDRPALLDCDAARLSQVIANLLNNAAKYSAAGGEICLTAGRRGDEVQISVKDNGVGISAADLPRVFDMFAQVESSLKESQGGLGIGLSLAKRLVEMHGGRIEVQSEGLGKGSNFIIYLPVSDTESPAHAAPADAPQRQVAGKRILVADDNHAAADTLAMLLEYDGHRIATAYDGEQALTIAESFYPEIILLDIGMPKLDGYEVAQRIRAEPWGRNIEIVAMSGWAQQKDQQRARESGFDHHLVKPVNPDELSQLIAASGN